MKEITDRRYPIGKFDYGKNYSIDETRKHIKSIARLPKELKKTLKKLRDGALDKPYRAGGWTARQVIHHLADSHMNAYVRFKLAATENAPIIKPYEETLWAETEDGKHGSAKTSIKLLSALHDRWVDFMMSLSDDDLERGYYHPASKRTVSLREAIALYAWHAKHHLEHIKMVAEGNLEKAVKKDKHHKLAPPLKTPKESAKSATAALDAGKEPKKRVMSEAHKAKIRAAQQARRASEKSEKPVGTTTEIAVQPKKRGPKPGLKAAKAAQAALATSVSATKPAAKVAIAPEKPKRSRRTAAEVAAEKAAKAAQPKLSRAEVMERARAVAAANRAAKAALAPKKVAPEKPKRIRRTAEEVAAEKAVKAAQPKLSRAEVMERARAVAAANRAAKAATAPKKVAPEKPKRIRRSAEEVAAEKAAKAAQPKLTRAEAMERARAKAAANRAAKGLPVKPKKDPNAPKLTRQQALERARAAKNKDKQ